MKKPANWDTTSAATEYKRPTAGGYVCRITKAVDNAAKEYVSFEFDIVEGEFKNYGADTLERNGWTPFHFNKSYKAKALSYFKLFTETVEATNKGFKYDFDETKLVGKGVGIVLQECEYTKKDGSIGTRLEPAVFKTAAEIRNGDFTVPGLKKLSDKEVVQNSFSPLSADDDDGTLPF